MWAVEAMAQRASDSGSTARHRQNIIHRLRLWAVASLADVRTAEAEERKGGNGISPLWQQLEREGVQEKEAKARANEGLRRFTPELLRGRIYDRALEIFADTPLAPRNDPDAPGDGDTFRASTRKIREAFARRQGSAFYLPSDDALDMLGWSDLAGLTVEIDRRIGNLFGRP
jgi:hypothetical protein